MSVTTNVIAKFKQLFHAAGANSNSVSDAIDAYLGRYEVILNMTGANATRTYSPTVDVKLVAAKFLNGEKAITNDTTNGFIQTIATNGVTVNTWDYSNAAAAIGANTATNLTITTTNSFVDAGEKVVVDRDSDGTDEYPSHVLLVLERQ